MREYKFRGQQINTRQWVYGYLYRNKGLYVICENIRYAEEEPILLDTIGQYTGMKDINGTEIYEGDIVAEEGHYVNSNKLVYQKIQWKDNYACWLRGEYQRLTPKNIERYKITVVGNIYNKSYLLEKPNE